VTYQMSEQPAAMVREEEFAKQLRLARTWLHNSLPQARPLEPALKATAPKQGRSVPKARSKPKTEPARQNAGEAELAKERRRAGLGNPRTPKSGPQRSQKRRDSPGR
jgi:hypothetical protein